MGTFQPTNYVKPQRVKVERKVDGILREISTDDFKVDVEGLPGLVARGVMPFRYLKELKDFKARFADCVCALDVNRVLASEGFYG